MNRPQEPLVSVVTPVYNGAKYLRECLESLIAQSYANWRCTVVNNRSTDDSLEIALHYASRDSRVTVHSNAEFLPIIDNLNRAYALIDRDCIYCKPLMADDWLYPECIATMVSCALTQPSIGLVCCLAATANNQTRFELRPADSAAASPTTVLPGRLAGRKALLENRYFFGLPTTMLIRADLIRRRAPSTTRSTCTRMCSRAMTFCGSATSPSSTRRWRSCANTTRARPRSCADSTATAHATTTLSPGTAAPISMRKSTAAAIARDRKSVTGCWRLAPWSGAADISGNCTARCSPTAQRRSTGCASGTRWLRTSRTGSLLLAHWCAVSRGASRRVGLRNCDESHIITGNCLYTIV